MEEVGGDYSSSRRLTRSARRANRRSDEESLTSKRSTRRSKRSQDISHQGDTSEGASPQLRPRATSESKSQTKSPQLHPRATGEGKSQTKSPTPRGHIQEPLSTKRSSRRTKRSQDTNQSRNVSEGASPQMPPRAIGQDQSQSNFKSPDLPGQGQGQELLSVKRSSKRLKRSSGSKQSTNTNDGMSPQLPVSKRTPKVQVTPAVQLSPQEILSTKRSGRTTRQFPITPPVASSTSTSNVRVSLSPQVGDAPKLQITSCRSPAEQLNASLDTSKSPGEGKRMGSPLKHQPSSKRRHLGSTRRKSKRRSSFVRGRISQPEPSTDSGLHKSISSSLPEDQRLAKLTRAAVQLTLKKLADEFPELDGMQQFQTKARDRLEKAVVKMEADGLFVHATRKEKYEPNPVNLVIEKSCRASLQLKNKLETESVMWVQMVELRQRLMEEAQERAASVASYPITSRPASLSHQQIALLDSRLNCNAMLDNLQKSREDVALVVDNLVAKVNLFQKFEATANTLIEEQKQKMGGASFTGIEDFDDPKKLIQKMLL